MEAHETLQADRRRFAWRLRRLTRTQAWVALAILMLIGFNALRLRGPLCLPLDAPLEVPSGARAQRLIAETIGEPGRVHPNGSAENIAVRDRLMQRLENLGFEVTLADGPIEDFTVSNIIALRKGTDSQLRPLMLSSHYDSSPYAPGAGDAGVAYSAILEAVRALRHLPPLRRDLYVVLTDAEERGLKGAQHLVDTDHPVLARRPIVFNFDARGSEGPCLMFETCSGDLPVVRAGATALPQPIFTSSLFVYVYKRLPRGSDFTQWQRAGLTGLNFALVGAAWNHHQPTDTLANVSPRTSQHYCDTAFAMVRRFDELDEAGWLADETRPNGVFFDLLSVVVISFSRLQMQVLALLGLVVALVAAWRTSWPRDVAIVIVFSGLMVFCLSLVGWAMGVMFRATPLAEHRFTPVGSYVAVAYAVASLALVWGAGRMLARVVAPRASQATVFLLWAVCGVVAAFGAPGVSYLLALPALLGAGLVALFPASVTARGFAAVISAIFLVPVLMLLQQVIGPGVGHVYCLAVGVAALPLIGICEPAARRTGAAVRGT